MAISIKKAVEIIRSGLACNLKVLQANINQGTGGKLLQLKNVKICRQSTTNNLSEATKKVLDNAGRTRKNPHHNYNFTLNLQTAGEKPSIITIHPALIISLNDQEVI